LAWPGQARVTPATAELPLAVSLLRSSSVHVVTRSYLINKLAVGEGRCHWQCGRSGLPYGSDIADNLIIPHRYTVPYSTVHCTVLYSTVQLYSIIQYSTVQKANCLSTSVPVVTRSL
jgi:hypothetical protein